MSLLSTIILGSLLRLIAFQNRSQLLYPSDSFVGIIENCEYSTKTVKYHFYNMRNHVLICMTCCMIIDHLLQNSAFSCADHKAAVCNVIIKTAAKPVLSNIFVE
jgi:hypothetical protein